MRVADLLVLQHTLEDAIALMGEHTCSDPAEKLLEILRYCLLTSQERAREFTLDNTLYMLRRLQHSFKVARLGDAEAAAAARCRVLLLQAAETIGGCDG